MLADIHEGFLNVLLKGGGSLYYDLVYDKEEAVFRIDVMEYCYNRYYTYAYMEYWSTQELYEELNREYPEKLLYDFD